MITQCRNPRGCHVHATVDTQANTRADTLVLRPTVSGPAASLHHARTIQVFLLHNARRSGRLLRTHGRLLPGRRTSKAGSAPASAQRPPACEQLLAVLLGRRVEGVALHSLCRVRSSWCGNAEHIPSSSPRAPRRLLLVVRRCCASPICSVLGQLPVLRNSTTSRSTNYNAFTQSTRTTYKLPCRFLSQPPLRTLLARVCGVLAATIISF